MTDFQNKLDKLIRLGFVSISKIPESELVFKASEKKWSKKEVLGHLIDSGINNLQRFTEIQFKDKPYRFDNYSQNELVLANDYQHSEITELLVFWKAINNRILHLFSIQNKESLSFEIVFDNGEVSDLRFLMNDYVNHLEHHLNQILS